MEAFLSEIFTFNGRLDRTRYFIRQLVVTMAMVGASYSFVFSEPAVEVTAVIVLVMSTFASLAASVRRLHDMNLSGLWAVTFGITAKVGRWFIASGEIMVPLGIFIAFAPIVVLLVTPGTDDGNRFRQRESLLGDRPIY